MIDKIFGEVSFKTGWCKNEYLNLFGKQFTVIVRAKSYRDTDFITDLQRDEYQAFSKNKNFIEKEIENLLINYKGKDFLKNLLPRFLIFKRGGGYALLLDDKTNPDNGLAIVLSPKKEVMTQDDYL